MSRRKVGLIILTAIITFLIGGLFGYVVHKSLHQKWMGILNKKHMTHHIKLYPVSDYLSDDYRDAGKDNTVIIFTISAIPLIILPIILGACGILPIGLVITSLTVMALMGFLHSYLHDAFHIRGHFLTKIPVIRSLFNHWNRLHYLHHVDMQKNFGIFLFHWDVIFNTLLRK